MSWLDLVLECRLLGEERGWERRKGGHGEHAATRYDRSLLLLYDRAFLLLCDRSLLLLYDRSLLLLSDRSLLLLYDRSL